MCVCVCVCVCTYVCMQLDDLEALVTVAPDTYVCMYVFMFVYICVCMYVCMHTFTYVWRLW